MFGSHLRNVIFAMLSARGTGSYLDEAQATNLLWRQNKKDGFMTPVSVLLQYNAVSR